MNILVTGGAGFVGSTIAAHIKNKYFDYNVYAFDNLRRRGSELNLNRLNSIGVKFIHGDIRNKEDIFSTGIRFDVIIDASADCAVGSGLNNDSEYVVNTNIMGTVNCLELARQSGCKVIFLSTSRVYGIESLESIKYKENDTRYTISDVQSVSNVSVDGINEFFSTNGIKSLYGATKLSSELLLQEYSKMFNFQMVINRCGILSGPWQMGNINQGIITTWLARHYWKRQLKYTGYSGKGKQVRDVLDARDLANLVDWQLHNMSQVDGEVFNIGGGLRNSVSLLELTYLCQEITKTKIVIDEDTSHRRNDIRIYITDNSKIKKLSGWEPTTPLMQTLENTYDWIKEYEQNLFNILG